MINFLNKIYKKILKLDGYTNSYLKISNHLELPALAYTSWGLYLADIKDFPSAIEKLETAMLMHGKNPKPCVSLGIIYAKTKEYDKAVDVLLEAIKRDSQNAYAYSVLSSVYVAIDKFSEAEDMLKKALKLAPTDAEVYLNYGIFYAKTQKKYKAIEMFSKSKSFNPANLHAFFLLGVMYYETGKNKEAFEEFKYVERINPKYKKLDYYIALCYQKEKNYDLVIQYAKKALKEEPNNPAIYVLLAHTFVKLDNKNEVLKVYELGEKNGICDFEFLLSAGMVYTKYNDINRAKNYLNKALSIQSNDTNALYRLGVCFKKEGNTDEAVKYFNKSLKSDPNNFYALTDLGALLYENNDYNGAVQTFFKVLNITNEKNYLYFYIANCYYKLGRLKKSIEFYEKTIEYYPEHIEALINCTIALLIMNNNKEALRKIRNAYQINRNSEKIILMYALTDLKCGIYSDAIEKADMLIEKNPNNSGAKLIKANTLICIKKSQKALELLNSLNDEVKNTEIYVFLSYLAYKTLVEENPSHYNESMLDLYFGKLDSIDFDSPDKGGLISFITK